MEKPSDSDMKNENPFRVPKDYFKELPLKIDNRVYRKSGVLANYPSGLKWAISGFVVAALTFFLIWSENSSDTADASQILSEVSDDAIQTYLENQNISYEEIIVLTDNANDLPENVLPDDIEIEESEFYEMERKLIFQ